MIWIFGYSVLMSERSSLTLSKNLSKSGLRHPCLNFAASCSGAMSWAGSFTAASAESTADWTSASMPESEKSLPLTIPFFPLLNAESVAVLSNNVLRRENSPFSADNSRVSFSTRRYEYFFIPLEAKPASILSAIFLILFISYLLIFHRS